jgi:hypothetical protein
MRSFVESATDNVGSLFNTLETAPGLTPARLATSRIPTMYVHLYCLLNNNWNSKIRQPLLKIHLSKTNKKAP